MGAPVLMLERRSNTLGATAIFLKKVVYAGLDVGRETSSRTGSSVAIRVLIRTETADVWVPQLYIW